MCGLAREIQFRKEKIRLKDLMNRLNKILEHFHLFVRGDYKTKIYLFYVP